MSDLAERLVSESQEEFKYRVFSGFKMLDGHVGGFRLGNVYLLAGLEKSGKTALLLNILNNLLMKNEKVGYINTELLFLEFANRLAAIYAHEPIQKIESDRSHVREWVKNFQKQVCYAGVGETDIETNGLLDFNKILIKADGFVKDGVRVLMIDNLTTFNTQAGSGRQGWEVLAGCIDKLVTFTKKRRIVTFVVIHTKPGVVFTETPAGIRALIQAGNAEEIFKKSVVVNRRPTLSDVYGGGGALSQLAGAVLLWRPFQKFNNPDYRKLSMLILESFRHSASGVEIEVYFSEEKGLFEEVWSYGEDKSAFADGEK